MERSWRPHVGRRVWRSLLLVAVGALVAFLPLSPFAGAQAPNLKYRLFLPGISSEPLGQPPGIACKIASVTDGDTVIVEGCKDAGSIRLILIDTPEVANPAECFGLEASSRLKALLPKGAAVLLERDVSDKDRFGRYLRYVWLNSDFINERMVREGYAALAVFPPDVKYQARIAAAQAEAKAANRGLWPACGGTDKPLAVVPPPFPQPPPAPPPPAPPPPPPPSDCAAVTATITALDKLGELVTVTGSGLMTGWFLISESGNQRFDFPAGFVLNGNVRIHSHSAQFANTATDLWWSTAFLWNNQLDDDAFLYSCTGALVSTFDDGI